MYFRNKTGRDKDLLADVKALQTVIDKGTVIGINTEMYEEWGIHAAFQRYHHISLDQENKGEYKFLLVSKRSSLRPDLFDYKEVNIDLNNFRLYEQ